MKYVGIHQLFHQTVERFRTNIAIDCDQRRVSYGELEDRSNHLANTLIVSGATKGSIIVILMEDAINFIPAFIGCLKAGCIFVPLDSRMPEKRLQTVVAEVAPSWFLIESRFSPQIAHLRHQLAVNAHVLRLDADLPTYGGPGQADATVLNAAQPEVAWDPDDMCYIFFTSGSTGRPKGIAGRLKGLDHFITWEIDTFSVGEGTRISQFTTPSFDAVLRDIFTPLCAGGTVCVPPDRETVLDARKLIDWIDASHLHILHCVPSLFRSMLHENLAPNQFQALRYILMAGEPLLPSDVGRWTHVYGERIQLVNLYGPSETTMTKFCYLVKPPDQYRRSVPIGKPIEGARALVVDEQQKPCPPGVVGEIYIRTPFRTLGYYKQPELTQDVFIQNPFSDTPNDLVYKTGDLARILEDGNFEFLGRKDHQVKIRGMRIELGDIETRLRQHPAIQDAVVVDRADQSDDKYLCAYVVLAQDVSADGLQAHLSAELPEGMIPTAYVRLDALPRTLSGKVDRQALPPPGQDRLEVAPSFVAPRNAAEDTVARIWSQLLDVERVGVYDNFFALGGHSLLATQLISRLRNTFQVDISLHTLFQSPTVAGVADCLTTLRQTPQDGQTPALRSVTRPSDLPLSFAQQRLWYLDQLEPGNPGYNISAAVRLHGSLDLAALEQSLNAVVQRHEALRTTFRTVHGVPVQVIAPTLRLLIPIRNLCQTPEAQREAQIQRLATEEAQRPFNLSQGPFLRATLLLTNAHEYVLLLTMHHIVGDGWSTDIFVREMVACYQAFSRGQEPSLPPLPVQYADFALWQREWLQGEALKAQIHYWQTQLGNDLPVLQLPTDHPRPAVQSFRGARAALALPQALSGEIEALSQGEEVTLFITLLAAFKVLLFCYTQQTDLVVGCPIANRSRVEIEGLIGFFANTLVLRTQLEGNPGFRAVLQQVRQVVVAGYAHQDLPFQMVVETLQLPRDPSRTPLFQVAFTLHTAPLERVDLPDLSVSLIEVQDGTAPFDLVFSIRNGESGLRAMCQYNTELFEAGTITRMLHHFELLLHRIVAQPDASLSELAAVLAEAEQREQDSAVAAFQETRRQKFSQLRRRPLRHTNG